VEEGGGVRRAGSFVACGGSSEHDRAVTIPLLDEGTGRRGAEIGSGFGGTKQKLEKRRNGCLG